MPRASTVIIGVGNYLMGDEGAGIHAIQKLRSTHLTDHCEIVDGGTAGFSLLHIIEDRDLAIIIDCADFGGAPGEMRIFDPDDLRREETRAAGLHATDILTVLDLARASGSYPQKVIIIGIQSGKIGMGTKLSAKVESALDGIETLLKKHISFSKTNLL